MEGFDPDIDRRSVLKNLGLAGVGGSALLGTNPVAASSSENKIEDIWGAMVDIAEEKLGEVLPWGTENVSTEERQRRFRELVGETNDVETEVYIPVDLPFSACYWTDYAVSGEKYALNYFHFATVVRNAIVKSP